MPSVQVHTSALKHGLSADTVIEMWCSGTDETVIDDDEPPRYMPIALGDAGRPWEVGALMFGGGARYLVIHAMRARKSVIERMQRRR